MRVPYCEACSDVLPEGISSGLCNPCWNLSITMGRHMERAKAVLEWLSNH
jgi:hypothetical protein